MGWLVVVGEEGEGVGKGEVGVWEKFVVRFEGVCRVEGRCE